MATKNTNLNQIITTAVESLGYEFVGYEMSPGSHGAVLRIYIDSPNGVLVDDCQKVSRHLSAVMDVEDPITGHYTLEISSPGVERPLFNLAQYQRFIGCNIKIRIHEPLSEQRNFTGMLQEVTDDTVVLKIEDESIGFKYSNIDKARLVLVEKKK